MHQLGKDQLSVVAVATMGVGMHIVVSDTLSPRHHHHHSLFSLFFLMGMAIWYQQYQILLHEILHSGAAVGMLDQFVALCLNHTQ